MKEAIWCCVFILQNWVCKLKLFL